MRKVHIALIAALLTTGLPAVAAAQDRGERGGDRGGRPQGGRPEGGRPDGGQRPQVQPQPAPQQQPQPQAQQQPRAEYRGDRGQQGRPQGQFRPDGRRYGYGGPNGRPGDYRPDGGPRPDQRPDFASGNGGRGDRGYDDRAGQPAPDRHVDPAVQGRAQYRSVPDVRRGDYRPGGYDRGPGYGGGYNGRPGYDRGWRNDWRADRRYDWRGYRSANRAAFSVGRYYAPRGWGYGYRRFSIGYRLPEILFAQSFWIDDPWAYRLPPVDGPYRWVRYYNDVLLVDLDTGEVVDSIPDFFF